MKRTIIKGIPVVEGVAIGKLQYIQTDYSDKIEAYKAGDVAAETRIFKEALKTATMSLEDALEKGTNLSEDERAIIEMHHMLIGDEGFIEMVISHINSGLSAPKAIISSVNEFKAMFAELDDEYLRDRANDIVDVGNRIIRKLLGIEETTIEGENLVLLAEDIEPALMASLSEKQVKAILLENGSKTSHTVIIAKSKGFVTMVGVKASETASFNGVDVIVDSSKGEAVFAPSSDEISEFEKKFKKQQERKKALLAKAKDSAVSKDGKRFSVVANVSSPDEVPKAIANGCEGVGLYRTEFLFMDSSKLPDEEPQTQAYKELLSQAEGNLCIIRTLDIGGDKKCECLGLEQEDNPFLGYRAIRICLDRKDMFKTQLRALLRASAVGKLGIMIPMVDTVTEIKEAKALFEESKKELKKEGIPFSEHTKFGIMTETPASALMAPVFAKYVDFFSIGTNDLVQYTMAVDRGNQKVGYLYDYFDPAVIRAIYNITKAGNNAGIMVGMCGEMAGDVLAIPLLMAVGLDEFSLSISGIPEVKEIIRNMNCSDVDIGKIFSLETASEVREYLQGLLNKATC